ncbi:hypothetical protein ADL22_00915 [Streptomyces sp. NRRL F-4489]|uniref:RCC1-like domain-containing protein n=1 Tax=Streptomyces sp. NRRL F-4489 TaxID=1609095 RepID=UPI0007491A8F|nr:RCC1 domain-containing protein [Streptomyces sp. NRRL F-4489]KUL55483.1 hypothetical protein ADL22_00915 [Streptomyces sp. NRRL F-4489]
MNTSLPAAGAAHRHGTAAPRKTQVFAWGVNDEGQADVPVRLGRVTHVAAGFLHSLAVQEDGTVAAWGWNELGQTDVPPDLKDATHVAAGGFHSLALRKGGTLAAWGWNGQGQTDVPVELSPFTQISAGFYHSLALRKNGTVAAWGSNYSGQTDVPPELSGVVQVSAGHNHGLALREDGTVVAWGSNALGQAAVPEGLTGVIQIAAGGLGNLALRDDGTVVAWGSGEFEPPSDLRGVVQVAASHTHGVALQDDGTVVTWGVGWAGQIEPPRDLEGVTQVVSGLLHDMALRKDGTVVSWGRTFVPRPPTEVLKQTVQLSAGAGHTVALSKSGTVTAWGDNKFGQTSISGRPFIAHIAAGWNHSLVVADDPRGHVYAAGDNRWGQSSVPPDLRDAVGVAAGQAHSLAVRKDGTVVAWGSNIRKQCEVPPGLRGVVRVAAGAEHSLALKKDGTVVAWGANGAGQSTVPDDVSEVVQVAAGVGHSVALRANGTVEQWGAEAGTVPDGLGDVVRIAAGAHRTLALKKDGTLVIWGRRIAAATLVPLGMRNVHLIAAGSGHNVVAGAVYLLPAANFQLTAAPGQAFGERLRALALTSGSAPHKPDPVENASITFFVEHGHDATFAGGAAKATVTTGRDGIATAPVLTAGKKTGSFFVHAGTDDGSRLFQSYRLTVTGPEPDPETHPPGLPQSPQRPDGLSELPRDDAAAKVGFLAATNGETLAPRSWAPDPRVTVFDFSYQEPMAGAQVTFTINQPAMACFHTATGQSVPSVTATADEHGVATAPRLRTLQHEGLFTLTVTMGDDPQAPPVHLGYRVGKGKRGPVDAPSCGKLAAGQICAAFTVPDGRKLELLLKRDREEVLVAGARHRALPVPLDGSSLHVIVRKSPGGQDLATGQLFFTRNAGGLITIDPRTSQPPAAGGYRLDHDQLTGVNQFAFSWTKRP